MSGSSTDSGAEPINFRAALAAFEGNHAGASPALHAPVPRVSRATKPTISVAVSTRDVTQHSPQDAVPISRATMSENSAAEDPVARSNSTPKIRAFANGRMPQHRGPNPFAEEPVGAHANGRTGDDGLLKAPWPGVNGDLDASRLRKTGSGTSLRDLMQRSLPDSQNRTRSKSLAGRSAELSSSGRSTPSTPASGTNSPRLGVKSIIALYGGNNGLATDASAAPGPSAAAIGSSGAFSGVSGADQLYGGALRTASPMSIASNTSLRSRHMLDPSNDDDGYDPLFGHAVMAPGPKPSSGLRSAPGSHPSSPQRSGSTASSIRGATATANGTGKQSAPPPLTRTVSSSQVLTSSSGLPARSTLQPPSPPRRGSQSSTTSVSSTGPRLPPRPPQHSGSNGSLVSEFGMIPPTAEARAPPLAENVTYATYTPGAKRHGQSHANGSDSGKAPPALPPRSATVGQASGVRRDREVSASRGGNADDGQLPYAVRSRSGARREVPKSPSLPSGVSLPSTAPRSGRPDPPPRPRELQQGGQQLDGNAGGFRFGKSSSSSSDSLTPPALPGRDRAPVQAHYRSGLGGVGSDPTSSTTASHTSNAGQTTPRGPSHSHAKQASNVFTSISLSDDASRELRGSLESDILQRDAIGGPAPAAAGVHHMPPPPRNKYGHAANRSIGSAMGIPSSPNVGQLSAGKSLWETASSALPLPFKTSASSGASGRALAEGAPSRQQQFAFRGGAMADPATSLRPGEVDNGSRLGWSGQPEIRPVQLAAPAAKAPARSIEPRDSGARSRYEALFDRLVQAQAAARAKKEVRQNGEARDTGSVRGKRRPPHPPVKSVMAVFGESPTPARDRAGSQVSTQSVPADSRDVSSGVSVEAAKGWFEPGAGSQTPKQASMSTPTSRSAPSGPTLGQFDDHDRPMLSMGRVRNVWLRSRLPERVLADVWDAAVAHQRSNEQVGLARRGLSREAFVRAMAAIDAELGRRAQRRRARALRQPGHANSLSPPQQRGRVRPLHPNGSGGGVNYPSRDGAGRRPLRKDLGDVGSATSRSSSAHSTRSRMNDAPSSPSLSSAGGSTPTGPQSTAQRSAKLGTTAAGDNQRRSSGESEGGVYGRTPAGVVRRVPPPPV